MTEPRELKRGDIVRVPDGSYGVVISFAGGEMAVVAPLLPAHVYPN